jgi:hypothetical protein
MANAPHGGVLKDLLIRDASLHDALIEEARSLKDIFLTEVSYGTFLSSRGSADSPSSDNYVTWSLSRTEGSRRSRDS